MVHDATLLPFQKQEEKPDVDHAMLEKRSNHSTSKLSRYLNTELTDDLLTECELLILAFATGMQDAVTFPDYLCSYLSSKS